MSDPVVEELSRARQQLLDLSARNRLLNFRPTRRTTVEIVDEIPDEVWRLLVAERRRLSFLAREEHALFDEAAQDGGEPSATETPEAGESAPSENASDAAPSDNQPDAASSDDATEAAPSGDANEPTPGSESDVAAEPVADDAAEPSPGEAVAEPELFAIPGIETALEPGEAGLAERYTDLFLQTSLSGEVLQTNLLQICRQAESFLEERGVNLLFLAVGLLEWTDADHPGRTFLAPLVLAPVGIERTSAQRRFKVQALDDDPLVNPCIERKLKDFRIDLPPVECEWDEFAPGAYLDRVRAAVAGQPGWKVHDRLVLGFFSFTKYLMYLDLDPTTWPEPQQPAENPLVRVLCGDESALPRADKLPDAAELDRTRDPEEIFQVLDADSSQMEAIYAALEGRSLVIEGPPGTGKSQTIANIIAECLAADRTVLFVSEKMAALEVVKRRLDAVGLGDFCLELHSTKANRRSVVAELGDRLEQGRYEARPCDDEARRLRRLKDDLAAYVDALGEPFGALAEKPYDAMGRAILLADVPAVSSPLPSHDTWDRRQLDDLKEQTSRLARQWRAVAPLSENPWLGVRLRSTTAEQRGDAAQACREAASRLDRAAESARALAERLGGDRPSSLESLRLVHEAGNLAVHSPRPPSSLIRGAAWDAAMPELTKLLGLLGRLRAAHDWMVGRYRREALKVPDWRDMHQRCLQYWDSPWRLLRPAWWSDRSLLKAQRDPEHRPALQEQRDDLQRLVAIQDLERAVNAMDDVGRRHFDALWHGAESDLPALLEAARWLGRFRPLVCRRVVGEPAMALAESGGGDPDVTAAVAALAERLGEWDQQWSSLCESLQLRADEMFGGPIDAVALDELRERLLAMAERTEELIDWARYQDVLQECEQGPLKDLVAEAIASDIQPEELPLVFEKRFLRLWMEGVLGERPALRQFSGVDREAAMLEFAKLDQRWLTLTRYRLQGRIASRRPGNGWNAAPSSQLGILQGEIRRKRGGRPIRRLLADAAEAVLRLTPCLMMSPLSVAQFLEPGAVRFDVVIFDEASQVEPADALGAVARGRQLILVGDPKQLPPTSFFNTVEVDGLATPSDQAAGLADMESILDRGMAAELPRRRLRWHYRSRHESLIAFSNREFYGDDLVVFPSSHFDDENLGLKLAHEPDDFYVRGRAVNPSQARRVAQRVFEHARRDGERTLGVGAFSVAQQQAILDELERLRREDDSLESFFARDETTAEPFFVKNLETIQGDERDVILLSIGYGRPGPGERLSMNFGPLNKDGGHRRLNVLITRARRRCEVFTSVLGEAFDLSATSAWGPQALKRYLDFARDGTLPEREVGEGEFESPFEKAVYNALYERGYKVHSQVGCRGYAIDLAVVDSDRPGHYVLGIECDGASYHNSPTARDRDRLRQQVLERLGWRIHRVWSTDWFRQPKKETERLVEAVETARAGQLPPRFIDLDDEAGQPAVDLGDLLVELAGDGPAIDVVEYRSFVSKTSGTPEQFYNESADRLARLVDKIVQIEGPIHRSELVRRVSTHYGFGRSGTRIEAKIERSLEAAARLGRLVERQEYLWPADMAEAPVRHRSSDAVREIDMVCTEEIARALAMLLASQFGMSRDDLVVQVARLLGFQMTGPRIRQRVESVIDTEIAAGAIVDDGQRLTGRTCGPA